MSEAGGQGGGGDSLYIIMALVLAIPLLAGYVRPHYNRVILTASNVMLAPISVVSQEARKVRAKIKSVPAESAESEFADAAWKYTGRWYRWLLAPLMLLMAYYVYKRSIIETYVRRLDMWQLVLNNLQDFPCLAPIVQVGPITDQPYNSGPWAVAKSPVQFAAENGLLLQPESGRPYPVEEVLTAEGLPKADSPAQGRANRLDEERLSALLSAQLGEKFGGDLALMAPHQLGLALAFLAQGMDQKDLAFKTFDQLSRTWDKETNRVNISGVAEQLAELVGSLRPEFVPEVEKHKAYVNVFLMALLRWARTKGALPSSLWIWLRPTDRFLFYSLNQLGGRTAWVEGLGSWSHYLAEVEAGGPVFEARVEKGAAGLRASLTAEGWLTADEARSSESVEHQEETEAENEKEPDENGSQKLVFDLGLVSSDDYFPDMTNELDIFEKPVNKDEKTGEGA